MFDIENCHKKKKINKLQSKRWCLLEDLCGTCPCVIYFSLHVNEAFEPTAPFGANIKINISCGSKLFYADVKASFVKMLKL